MMWYNIYIIYSFSESGEYDLKNILILNISRLPAMSAVCDYRSDEGLISGEYTNDAPAKYILKKLISSGKSLDRIICIRTA